MTRRPVIALVAALLAGACAPTEPTAPASSATSTGTKVEVVNIAFSPSSLEIAAGTEVTWVNLDEGVRHTATSGMPGDNGVPGVSDPTPALVDDLFDGDLPDASASFSFTFEDAGTYAYFCRVHPSMTAEIVVR